MFASERSPLDSPVKFLNRNEAIPMDDGELLEFFCYDEASTPSLECPLCMGRLFRALENAIYTCDTCDKEFTVSDDPLKDVV